MQVCEHTPAPHHSGMLGGHPTPAPPRAQAPAMCRRVPEHWVKRTSKYFCTHGLREQNKATSNTPKTKRLKKLCPSDYKNLNWKLFKRHPKEKGKRAAKPDSPDKVSLLTSSPPIYDSCVWLHLESTPALSDVSPSHKYPLKWEAVFGGTGHSGTGLPTDFGMFTSWDWRPPAGRAPVLARLLQQCHRASSSSGGWRAL